MKIAGQFQFVTLPLILRIMKIYVSFILLLVSTVKILTADEYKRDRNIDILNYSFAISISDTTNSISGIATLTIGFTNETSSMELDLSNIKSDGKGMIVDSVMFTECGIAWSHRNDKLVIKSDQIIKAGLQGKVRIVYHGIPSDGLIISKNKFGGRTFFSDNWPDRARNYIPCIDHPHEKATVDFIITAPEHLEVVANGYLTEESHIDSNSKVTHWKEDVPLATKVMAFGAADFDVLLAGKPSGIPVWTYVFKENRREGFNDYAIGVKPIEFYSKLIGPYPYEKLANVQSKTTFGGLENASCIFYSENSVTGLGKAEGLIAHETAHQWFGNSVTEDDWHHIWLSEGFATYLTSVYFEMNYGRERLNAQMNADRNRILKYNMKSPQPVIDTTIVTLMRLLNPNSYQKGAWILHMLRHEIGEEAFWNGIRTYYAAFRERNVLTTDFEKIIERICGKNLSLFFYQWLYIPGQPDLKISYVPSKDISTIDIVIEQTQKILFSFPLDILIKSQGVITRKSLYISERITRIETDVSGKPEIIPDPDVNLLFRQVNEGAN